MAKVALQWKVKKTVRAGCPNWRLDPYTGDWPPPCTIAHYKDVEIDMRREFQTVLEAVAFREEAPLSCHTFTLIVFPEEGEKTEVDKE